MKFAFICEQAAKKAFPVAFMCPLLEVSVSGFYAWRSRPASAHQVADAALGRLISTLSGLPQLTGTRAPEETR